MTSRQLTLRAFSARVNLAADTIFIEEVIFLMFLTLFSRVSMSFNVAIPLAPEGVRVMEVLSQVVAMSLEMMWFYLALKVGIFLGNCMIKFIK